MEIIHFMAAPLIICALIAAITAYLGIHIITRGVIFVDIALAQMAALGAASASLLHHEPNSYFALGLSFLFTFTGALFIAWIRKLEKYVPAEAYIGVLYVVGAALVILIADRSPHGAEHIKELLVGQILWVSWSDVLRSAVVYAIVGAVFCLIHKKLYAMSLKAVHNEDSSRNVFLYDILFYTLFGIVVTLSVRVAGVLLVFTYLVIPAMIAALFTKRFALQLAVCWCMGLAISVMGVSASYFFDMPTGATIVAGAGAILLAASAYKRLAMN